MFSCITVNVLISTIVCACCTKLRHGI